jgi:two-component system nitrate/nitrite response regulator NarL
MRPVCWERGMSTLFDTRAGDTVLVVDDHRLVGESLRTALMIGGLHAELSDCTTGASVLEGAARIRPSVVLLDLDLAQAGRGDELISPLVSMGSRVLVLTGTTDPIRTAECLEQGAAGVLSKTGSITEIVDAVQRVMAGDVVTSRAMRARHAAELDQHRREQRARLAPFASLSLQERRVLGWIVDGFAAEEIAHHLVVSLNTVRTQIRSILRKLGVNSQLAAVAVANQAGWVVRNR